MPEHIVNPGEKINDAIDKAEYGDVVRALPGRYPKQVVSINKSGVAYRGLGAIIDGEYLFPQGNVARSDPRSDKYHVWEGLFDVVASDVVVEGFEVTRSLGRGLRLFNNIQEVLIKDMNVHHIRGAGTLINQDTKQVALENVDVSQSNNYAPYSRSAGELDWGGGISIKGQNISLLNCRVFENWGEGILIFGDRVEDIVILGCEAFDNYALQLYIDHGIRIRIGENCRFYFENPDFHRGGKPPTTIAIANEERLGPDHLSEDVEIADSEFWGGSYHFGLWNPVKDVLFTRNTLRDAAEGVFQSFGSPNENVRIIENIIYHEDESEIFNFESDAGIDYSGNTINPDPDPDPAYDHKEILGRLGQLETDQAETSVTLIAQEGQIEDLARMQRNQNETLLALAGADVNHKMQFDKIKSFFVAIRDLISEFLEG